MIIRLLCYSAEFDTNTQRLYNRVNKRQLQIHNNDWKQVVDNTWLRVAGASLDVSIQP